MQFSRVAVACSAAVLAIGCAKNDQAAKDSAAAAAAAATPAPPPAPAPFSMADAAGKWNMRAVPATGTDTTATTYVLTATADTAGWVIAFPSGLKVPVKVSPSADSIIITTGKFASQRRKGVTVSTNGSFHLSGGKLTGSTTAHYSGAKAGKDTVLVLSTEGTKQP